MAPLRKYSDEVRARGVQLWRAADPKPSMRRLAAQLGVHPEALRTWIRGYEAVEAYEAEERRRRRTEKPS